MLLTLAFDILHVYGLFMTSKHLFHIKSGYLQPGDIYMKDLLSTRVTTCLCFACAILCVAFIGLLSERPMVMHAVKWEKCQILWMGPFHGMYLPPIQHRKIFELHFWVQDQKLWNSPPPGYLVEIWEKSTFSCTVQWCMQICHKHFPHHMRATWKCEFTLFPIVNTDFKWL